MVRLQAPQGMGSSISIEGFNLEVDDKGGVDVPKHLAQRLRDHGMTDPAPNQVAQKTKGAGAP